MDAEKDMFAKVILPLKLRGDQVYTYRIPEDLKETVKIGSRVIVKVVATSYLGTVCELTDDPGIAISKIRPIVSVEPFPPASEKELTFWRRLAEYYMCTVGEVYAAAYPASLKPSRRASFKSQETDSTGAGEELSPVEIAVPQLSPAQKKAKEEILEGFAEGKTTLLNGVTGSGKTEIYLSLIADTLKAGKSVLFMLPEIAVSRQLSQRLKKVLGERLQSYHSGISPARRKEVLKWMYQHKDDTAYAVAALRSGVFLPFRNLGLVIVDEEHDASYKQSEPAPRYNGRDAAIMLAQLHHANVLLGSATPSFESLHNASEHLFRGVVLTEKYNSAPETIITMVDMRKRRRERAVDGSISFILRDAVKARLERHEQTIVFRARRAYSPAVICSDCGEIPRCPHCGIALVYHRFDNTLKCHICGFTIPNPAECPHCGSPAMHPVGAGTEKIEEELKVMFPEARIARYDTDVTKIKGESERILKAFSKGELDILVGTQMLSKGFDFSNLTLAAVIQGESLTSVNDFRADEKAIQLLTQLKGRVARRDRPGEMIIQTDTPEHPIFSGKGITPLLDEREGFLFPPFCRIIEMTLHHKSKPGVCTAAASFKALLREAGIDDYEGPTPPPSERIQDEYLMRFTIRMPRTKSSIQKKKLLAELIAGSDLPVIADVDPL